MTRFTLAALAAAAFSAILMSGCATDGAPEQASRSIDHEDAPTGSMFKRKPGTAPASVDENDRQALEAARVQAAAAMQPRQ